MMAEADQPLQDPGHDHGHDRVEGPYSHHPVFQDDGAFTEANRVHFNKSATLYIVEQWHKDMRNKITAFIQQHVDWIGVDFVDPSTVFETSSGLKPDDQGKQVRVLDYACGPGSITHALGARATEYIGIDVSENMVQAYNLRFGPSPVSHPRSAAEGLDSERGLESEPEPEAFDAHAVVGNLLIPTDPSPQNLSSLEFYEFDLVVVGLGYHHFANIPLATRRLVERLRHGGVFLIIDFVTHAMEDPGVQPAAHTVAHQGFSEQELRQYFEDAGLSEFAIVRMGEEVLLRGTKKREPFMARGRKPLLS